MAGAALRLCLFNPIDPARPLAERELALRMAIAVERLGWSPIIAHNSATLAGIKLDAVLNLFPVAAGKMTDHLWLACAWGPASLLAGMAPAARQRAQVNELSHDAYLISGTGPRAHLESVMRDAGRIMPPHLPFHVSSPRSDLPPTLGPDSRLFYVGANWDGQRYPALLRRLAQAGALALHGTAERWSHLADAWRGPLPFDGISVIQAAHHWGMGLCLHLPQHRAEAVPNMRVFELAAAGAVIITDCHPFIEQWFGDSVLYVDTEGGEEAAAAAILDQFAWVHRHREQARAMALQAQALFNQHLCLEALLGPLPDLLASCRRPSASPAPLHIAVLLPEGEGQEDRLAQLARQTGPSLTLTALVPASDGPLPPVPAGISLRDLSGPARLDTLLAAMADADALTILPEGVEWFAGHLARLAQATSPHGAALATGLWPRPAEETGFPLDPAETMALTLEAPDAADRRLASATLRAGGLFCRKTRLAGLGAQQGHDWLDLALALAPTLAMAGDINRQPVPGHRLSQLPPEKPDRVAALPPWPTVIQTIDAMAERPALLTGISDLDPVLAGSIPWLWRPDDFQKLPDTGPLWLYGAGRGGELVLAALSPTQRARLRGFLDSHRRGERFGLPLCQPQDLDEGDMEAATIIIAAQYVSDILRHLQQGAAKPARIFNAYPYIAAVQEAMGNAG
ncbi:glycosyltransferase [Niveispirillum irakense]|uniref:glycosyltransferase family protein n=1 Tax=Niveispirillum irakense TaxID=34011 RepID=UPI00041C6117|nr:glycosyltransferase [Niveispirillum irakense]